MEQNQGWERYPGTGAQPRDGRGTQGWGRYPQTGAQPRDRSTAPGWSHARGWAHDSEAAQASLQPQPFCSPPLQHGLRLPGTSSQNSLGRWLPSKSPLYSQPLRTPGDAGAPCLGLTPQRGRGGSSSERAPARRMPCAPEGTSPGPDPRPASSKEPAAACQGDAGGSGLTWFLSSSPSSLARIPLAGLAPVQSAESAPTASCVGGGIWHPAAGDGSRPMRNAWLCGPPGTGGAAAAQQRGVLGPCPPAGMGMSERGWRWQEVACVGHVVCTALSVHVWHGRGAGAAWNTRACSGVACVWVLCAGVACTGAACAGAACAGFACSEAECRTCMHADAASSIPFSQPWCGSELNVRLHWGSQTQPP